MSELNYYGRINHTRRPSPTAENKRASQVIHSLLFNVARVNGDAHCGFLRFGFFCCASGANPHSKEITITSPEAQALAAVLELGKVTQRVLCPLKQYIHITRNNFTKAHFKIDDFKSLTPLLPTFVGALLLNRSQHWKRAPLA